MSAIHTTSTDEALDLICVRHYGQHAGAVEQVLEANPGIAGVAHRLPAGLVISLPDIVTGNASRAVRLWD